MSYFWSEHSEEAPQEYRGLFIPDAEVPPFEVRLRRFTPAKEPSVEYDPILGGWWKGDRKLHHFRPKKFFTRPHDGKRPGALGRLKDAFTGEGADVFVTLSGSNRTVMRDRPPRHQWTNSGENDEIWERWGRDKGHQIQDEMWPIKAPWTKERDAKPDYNFRTRKFEAPNERWFEPDYFWSDARWPAGVKRSSKSPLSKTDAFGVRYDRVPRSVRVLPAGRPVYFV